MEVLKKELGIASYGARVKILQSLNSFHKPDPTDSSFSHTISRIDFEELQLCELLGKGFFGEVRRAVWHRTDVAVKIIYRDSFGGNFGLFEKEVLVLSHIRHPNVIMILAITCTEEGNNCIVTEYMEGGSLHAYLKNHFLSLNQQPSKRHKIVSDICKGMAYLHANKPKPILHRDLTSHNVLIDRNGNTKVADFGLSRVKQEKKNQNYSVGQIPWMSPEVLKGGMYTEKADVYSFGCIMFELWTGHEIHFKEPDLREFATKIIAGYEPELPALIPQGWKNLIKDTMHPVPSKRPSFKTILDILDDLTGASVQLHQETAEPQHMTNSSDTESRVSYIENGFPESYVIAEGLPYKCLRGSGGSAAQELRELDSAFATSYSTSSVEPYYGDSSLTSSYSGSLPTYCDEEGSTTKIKTNTDNA